MKKLIKQLPVIGSLAVRLKRLFAPQKKFETSGKYWDDRYRAGGNSGSGSYDNLAEFKGQFLNKFVVENNVEKVLELGCGDGNQLSYFTFPSYVGFDISPKALEICRNLYSNDPTKEFVGMDKISEYKSDLALSLDVLYHLVEDRTFDLYMNQLFNSSTKFVIVYSCNFDDNENYEEHVRPRKFTNWIEKNRPEFKLIDKIENKYPEVEGDEQATSFADFYIFQQEK